MSHSFKVGFDLKGDKIHHQAIVTIDKFDPLYAREYLLKEMKQQRIVRALVLIDCEQFKPKAVA